MVVDDCLQFMFTFQNSSEKESTTDLKNLSPPTAAVQPTKRPIEAAGDVATFEDNTTEPSAKKLKSCVEGAEVPASAPSGPPQPPPGPPEEAPLPALGLNLGL